MNETRICTRLGRYATRTLAVIGGVVVALLLVALMFTVILADRVPQRTILELDLAPGLIEWAPQEPVALALTQNRLRVRDVVEALERGAGDRRVRGLVARVGVEELPLALVEELRDAVLAFRASGKPAILFAESFGELMRGHARYYLATAFEEIVMQPSGDVGVAGLAAWTPFVAGTLERLGIEAEMDHRHEYKAALYLWTEREHTPEQREALLAILETLHGRLVAGMAEGRGMDESTARSVLDAGPYWGEEAVAAGLVDRLGYRDQVYEDLRERVGGGDFLFVQRYLARAGRPHRRGPTIALVYGVGAVMRGRSQFDPLFGQVMGSESVAAALREAIRDDDVRAIVFRVESPGGSYVASDAIWREVIRAREAEKPVVVSMGSVAGSGGYFVAMGADRIIAQPSTITASIGVVGGKFATADFWEQLGVTWDGVEVGDNAGFWSTVRQYTPQERERRDDWLDRVYEDFTGRVAAGRGMTPAEVDAVARGRIWSGEDALRLGLVDELGGFPTALRLAREAAGIEPDAPVRLRLIPEDVGLLRLLLRRLRGSGWGTDGAGAAAAAQSVQPLLEPLRAAGVIRPPGALVIPPGSWIY